MYGGGRPVIVRASCIQRIKDEVEPVQGSAKYLNPLRMKRHPRSKFHGFWDASTQRY